MITHDDTMAEYTAKDAFSIKPTTAWRAVATRSPDDFIAFLEPIPHDQWHDGWDYVDANGRRCAYALLGCSHRRTTVAGFMLYALFKGWLPNADPSWPMVCEGRYASVPTATTHKGRVLNALRYIKTLQESPHDQH